MSVSINGTNGLVFSDGTSQNTSPFTGGFQFRNRIINGDMRIDQRNSGGAVTSASTGVTYIMDRFYQFVTQASKLSVQQVAAPAGFTGFTNAAKITVSSAATIGTTDVFAFDQAVEGYNIADLKWGTANAQPITVSFWAQSSVAGSYPCIVLNASGNRSYINTFTLAANTPTYVSVTFPGDTSGTWGTTNSTGIYLIFGLGVGTTYQNTPNQWNSGNYNGTSTTVQFAANAGATFYITGIQLEKGSTATSFDYRPYGTELALCQRYYQLTSYYYRCPAGYFYHHIPFTTTMRTTPTCTYSGYVSEDGSVLYGIGGVSMYTWNVNHYSGGGGAGGMSFNVQATAEL